MTISQQRLNISNLYLSGKDISSPNDQITIPYPFSDDEEYVGMFVLGKFPQFGCTGHKHVLRSNNLNIVHWCQGYDTSTGIGMRFVSKDYPNGEVATMPDQILNYNLFGMMGSIYIVGTGVFMCTQQVYGTSKTDIYYYSSVRDISNYYGGDLKWEPIAEDLTVTYPQFLKYIYFYNVWLTDDEIISLLKHPDHPPTRGLVSWIDFSRMVDLVRGGVVGE